MHTLAPLYGEQYLICSEPSNLRNRQMPTVRINYDGWLALPAAVRQRLHLNTGDQLDLELTGGTIVLRPAQAGVAAAPDRAATEPAAVPAQPAVAPPAPAMKRGPGRPRKTPKTPLLAIPAT